ncbi:MAG: pilus assembly protein TadG-related protein [Terriglobales bacterium]
MRRHRIDFGTGKGKDEPGVIITLVAVFMLFVVGAMAALSIDVVTIYTARSEAQLAADSAALAAARVLANSGATSDGTGTLLTSVESSSGPAQAVALQVAEQNQVGGVNLTSSQITVTFPPSGTVANPTVNVKIQTNLPTFFARIWGRTQVTVAASGTAEAYNPSATGVVMTGGPLRPPAAPICVKPWLLPNISPKTGGPIFNAATGGISDTTLLGWSSVGSSPPMPMSVSCTGGNCGTALLLPSPWQYYPGDPATTFPPPTTSLPSCSPALSSGYQESIAGCIQVPISCNTSSANIDFSNYPNRSAETASAVNCLTHATNNGGDSVASPSPPSAPFQFVAGADNPIPGLANSDVMVSDSLVTVPVFDNTGFAATTTNVPIIGFVQLFLNPIGNAAPGTGNIDTTVVNLAGCGTPGSGASGTAIVGNGASPVAVRLISPP